MAGGFQRLMARSFKHLPPALLLRLSGGTPTKMGGRTLDPLMQFLAKQAEGAPSPFTLTPDIMRAGMGQGAQLTDITPRLLESSEIRLIPVGDTKLPIRIYRPRHLSENPAIVLWFHQGGFVIGDAEIAEPFCTQLADEAGVIVINVDYRMAPEHPFPAWHEDAMAAYSWAVEHAVDLGGSADRIAVGGDSAGGTLAATLTHELKESDLPQAVFQFMLYPFLVLEPNFDSYQTYEKAYPLNGELMSWFLSHIVTEENEEIRKDLRLSPYNQPDFSGLPPAYIATSGFDPLTDEGEAYAKKLEAAGVPVTFKCHDSLTHSFSMMGGIVPAAYAANQEVASALKAFLAAN